MSHKCGSPCLPGPASPYMIAHQKQTHAYCLRVQSAARVSGSRDHATHFDGSAYVEKEITRVVLAMPCLVMYCVAQRMLALWPGAHDGLA